MVVRVLIIVLALAGLADALYFTFAYYGRIKKARWVPEVLCAREESSCVNVVQTPYARVFGLPNSLFGIVYYLFLMLGTTSDWGAEITPAFIAVSGRIVELGLLVAIFSSAGTVILGLYLIYSLRRKLHVDCPLCYTAHAVNTVLFILLILLAAGI